MSKNKQSHNPQPPAQAEQEQPPAANPITEADEISALTALIVSLSAKVDQLLTVKKDAEEKDFRSGFGIALVELIKMHGHDELAADIIQNAGYSLDHFIKAGLEQRDLVVLRKALQG